MVKKPEKVFRVGFVSGSVFANDIETGAGKRTIRSVNVQRRYVDGDETKYVPSFGMAEIPHAIRVLQLAQQYVESREAEVKID